MPIPTQDVSIQALTVLNGESCAKGCAEEGDCVFAMVSNLGNEASPWVYINTQGGIPAGWTGVGLTTWLAEDPTDIFGLGDLVMIVNGGEALPIARSLDQATTFTYLSGHTSMTTNEPYAGDMITPAMILVVGQNGYVWMSNDLGDTWTEVESGAATTENLTKIMICRQDPSVVYAIGENNAIIKSTNGGYSWLALTGPSAGDALTALEVMNPLDLIVGNDDGELWQSTDGGETWIQQSDLPSLPAAASVKAISCCACGSVDKAGVCYAAVEDTGASDHVIYRNAGYGAGQWQVETGFGSFSVDPVDIICCNNNIALAVAGNGTNSSELGLIK